MSQVLSLPATIAKKMESLLSSFLFSSKPERLRLEELYSKSAKGGLELLNIRKKANSLFLNQLTRMLLKQRKGAYRHLSYWLGGHMRHYLPALMDRSPVLHTAPPRYHQYALDLLIDGLKPTELGQATSKLIYSEYTKNTISEPKVTNTFLQMNYPAEVWLRFSYSMLTVGPRQAVFDRVFGLVRNCARLFQQARVGAELC